MGSELRREELGDVADVVISNVDKKTKPDETPVLLCNYTDVYYNGHIRGDMPFMSATANEREIKKCKLRKGDVVITKDSEKSDDIGVPAYISEDVDDLVCGYHLVILRPKNDVLDGAFLYYALCDRSNQKQFHARANGITRFGLRKADIGTVSVPLPPLSEQRAIAAVLGSLDDKIALNRRMNRTLESMARAWFQSWFVDFDPVHANAAGEATLPADLAAHFPAAFSDSPLGDIPAGWEVASFNEHIKAVRGLSYKGSGLSNPADGLPMHNLNSIYEGGGYKQEGIKYYAGEYKDKHLLHAGDMIITNTEQGHEHRLIGHAAIVPDRFGDTGLFSHHIYRITPKKESPLTRHYLYYLFNTDRWHKMVAGYSNGTSINMLPLDALKMPLLVVPPVELVDRFDAFARDVTEKIEAAHEESRILAALRDALLPKLLRGVLAPRRSQK